MKYIGRPELEFCEDCGNDFAIFKDPIFEESYYLGNFIIFDGQFICDHCRKGIRNIRDWYKYQDGLQALK